jgi:hypothetical protein
VSRLLDGGGWKTKKNITSELLVTGIGIENV